MTRSGNLAAAIVVLLAGMTSNVLAFDPAQWKYQAAVTIEGGTGEYCGLTLAPGIYDAARPDLGDIRLVDTHGEQVPYVLAEPKDITKRQKFQPAIINRVTNADGAAMVTLDFADKAAKNSIEVITQDNNFRRAVKVEGSNDNIEFFTLIEHAYVFAVSYDRRFEQVDLPANDYRYLRITVSPMAGEEKSPVIDEVRAFKIEESLAERQPVEMVPVEHSEDEQNNSSLYVYDLVYRRLPVSEIKLDIADDSFYRYVAVEGRDAATRKVKVGGEDNRQRFREVDVKWERITSDAIYRYTAINGKEHERLVLRIPSGRRVYRYLRIAIRNYDDRPILIRSASANMIAHRMVFESKDDAVPVLYVGSESARKPRYDLERRLSDPSQIKTRMAELSGITGNPAFGQAEEKSVPWTEKHKVLLLVVMVAVALVLGGFMLKSFKSIQSEQVQD
ncbi:MAG: DUF3999 family protein [Planctomycetota bacterium]|jgi:hypothetical protein